MYHFSARAAMTRQACRLMKTGTFLNAIVLLSVMGHLQFSTKLGHHLVLWEEVSLSVLHQKELVGVKCSFCLL